MPYNTANLLLKAVFIQKQQTKYVTNTTLYVKTRTSPTDYTTTQYKAEGMI